MWDSAVVTFGTGRVYAAFHWFRTIDVTPGEWPAEWGTDSEEPRRWLIETRGSQAESSIQ